MVMKLRITITVNEQDSDVKSILEDIRKIEVEIEKTKKAFDLLKPLNCQELEKYLWWHLSDLHTKKRNAYHALLMCGRIEKIEEITQ